MKKNLLFTASLLFIFALTTQAQIGVGLGSHGINIRTSPDAKRGLILRTGFGLTSDPLSTYVRPEAAWIRRHHYSEKTKLYAGIGATGEMRMSVHELSMAYGLMVPVGLELFPMGSKRLSVSLETGLRFQGFGAVERELGNYALLEITFYLNHHEENY